MLFCSSKIELMSSRFTIPIVRSTNEAAVEPLVFLISLDLLISVVMRGIACSASVSPGCFCAGTGELSDGRRVRVAVNRLLGRAASIALPLSAMITLSPRVSDSGSKGVSVAQFTSARGRKSLKASIKK